MRRSPSRRFRAPLALEVLEDRLAPAVFMVTTTADDNNGAANGVSLREAILLANNSVGADTINFGILGSGVQTISPTSPLPTVTGPTTINGYSQPGSKLNSLAVGNNAVLLIEINGTGTGAGAATGFGLLRFNGGNNTVRGLILNRCATNGLWFFGSGGNRVEGNFIGTDATGTVDLGNGVDGVVIDVPNNFIGGTSPDVRNVIAGNGRNGIGIFGTGANENFVEGNYIGTNATGIAAIPNGTTADGSGVVIVDGQLNRVGGTAPGAGNVLSGNGQNGVGFFGAAANANVVEGNFIGTNPTGIAAIPNGHSGVVLADGTYDNRIGGPTDASRNLISGNSSSGVFVLRGAHDNRIHGNRIGTNAAGTAALGNGSPGVHIADRAFDNTVENNLLSGNSVGTYIRTGATGNVIRGNWIGTNALGTAGIPNVDAGVVVDNAASNTIVGNRVLGNGGIGVNIVGSFNNTVGGTATADRNWISGNLAGVSINAGSSGNVVKGNWIGIDASGIVALPNTFDGVTIATGAHDNTIGGPDEADRNVIAGNNGLGIQITAGSHSNLVQNNYIGADANGGPLGNGVNQQGVGIFSNSDSNSILDNLILANSRSGISVGSASSTGNTFYRNRILGNGWVPIDLHIFSDANQVTLNDLGDGDSGANNYQNFPFIAGVNMLGPNTFISGSLYSTPSTAFRLEFFAADALSPSGHRQAQYLLGTLDVSTDASGLASFVFGHTGSLPGPIVTATATNLATGDTSEFFNPSAPTFIKISNLVLAENAGANALVGNLDTTDADLGDAHFYSLVGGDGDTDNGLFTIVGNELRAVGSLDYEAGATRSVRIRTTDLHGLTFVKVFTITIIDVKETPTITSGNFTVPENTTAAGTVTATDPDAGTTLAYSLVGGADQTQFSINAATGELTFNTAPDFEDPADTDGNNVYVVTVQASDGNISASQAITVTVTNVNESPTITSGNFSVPENTTAAGTISATDPDAGTTLTYSLVGGADQARFSINATTGALTFNTAPDFEVPGDVGGNNVYDVTVQVGDGAIAVTQALTVAITGVNDAPAITSDGGEDTAARSVAENTTAVTTVAAVDPDAGATLLFAISGGADASRFAIDPSTGAVRFLAAPDFEAPNDADANNVYLVQVQVSDGTLTDIQSIAVTVTDVSEQSQVYIGQGCCDSTALVVQGTEGNDKVRIIPQGGGGNGAVKVVLNGTEYFFAADSFTSIVVYGKGGDDDIRLAGPIGKNARLDGGSGNDFLEAGAGDDILLGGDGSDTLHGGQGRDLLIGGRGADRLVGNADDDILIAGTTNFDANDEALCSIMDEWTRCDLGYTQRIAHLRQGGGLNGNVKLTDDTVHDDDAVDKLTGSAGRDWFFANLDCGVRDDVTDDHCDEVCTDIDF